jgi:predicted hydrocarbon binding protein
MLWDPKRFPKVMYDWIKFHYNIKNWRGDRGSLVPRKKKLVRKLFLPKSLSEVNDMKKIRRLWNKNESIFKEGKTEYLEDTSRTNAHHFRIYENYECWGFKNVGAPLAIVRPAMTAALMNNLETEDKDWNVVHTKCIGLGHPYCEHKSVLGQSDELTASLEKDSFVIEEINERLMGYIMDFLLLGKPLMERPTLGSYVHIHQLQRITNAPVSVHDLQQITNAPISTEKLQLIFRMGGAKTGKIMGENLMDIGLSEEDAIKNGLRLIDYCKAGKITLDETLRIYENAERFGFKSKEPSCYFTTGFLNGLFYVVKNQHLSEIKCIGTGDPYCEWEIR